MLSRLLKMGIGEVTDRSRQEASKWLERRGMKHHRPQGGFDLLGDSPRIDARLRRARFINRDTASASRGRWELFAAKGPGRFFEGATDASTSALLAPLSPAARDRIVASAESILLGRFDLLGYKDLDFGSPVDWHLDPISGRRSLPVHWSLIDATDFASVGDSKVVWELSRQQHLVTLGVAYRMTGDERFSQAFAGLTRAWLRGNPTGLGINWASSLEAALRIVSWCWTLFLFRSSKHLTPDVFAEIAEGIGAHASHIERYLSRHSSPNTHLTGEALGLFYAGVLFPENKSAARWRALGQEILEEQIHIQVLEDGVYFEQSTAYQGYTVEIYLHYLILARRNDTHVSTAVSESVQRMLDVLLALRRPDGVMPAIGDADGGALLPLNPRKPDDARGLFATAAAFFGRPDYAWAAEGAQPEALWLLGSAAIAAFEAIGAAPPTETSRAFPDGGYVVMRSGWQRDAHHLVFDAGPLGCPLTSAHGHADLLSVQVSPFGEPCVVDPGTYAYSADPAFRDHFRGTSAHSILMVDGQGQAEPMGPFRWRERPAAKLKSFLSTSTLDIADASHEAYRRFADPVVHRRRVVFLKAPGYWMIVDDLVGLEEHRIDLRFQFAPLHVQAISDDWVRAVGSRGRGLLLRTFAREPLGIRIAEGSTSPIEGWVSPNYGQRQPAPVLIYSTTARLPLRILTLLVPASYATMAPPLVQPVLDQDGMSLGLVLEERGETIRFDAKTIVIERSGTCRA